MTPHAVLVFSTMLLMGSSAAAEIDLRQCPLDTVVFTDPWGGDTFAVNRVGSDLSYVCEDGAEPPSDLCMGPVGDLVLDGILTGDTGEEGVPKYAIYTVIRGAPCCDWNVTDPADTVLGENFKWLEPAAVPLLGDQPFLSIESEYGEDFGNPMMAVACTLRD
jgi:hypothetical protein